jgi:hypothetical protein
MRFEHAERSAWIVGGLGLIGSATGLSLARTQFAHAWLAALTGWIGWPLGSLALIFIHALTGGRWGFAIRRQLAMGVATLPLVIPAMLPVLLARRTLYPWMHPEVAAQLANHFYLNAPFFYLRGIVYLIVWFGLALLVLRALRQPDPEPILYRLAAPGLILLALTVTFSAIDFTLSMEPHFKSSIYGMLVGCEAILLALSIALMASAGARHAQGSVHDLGRLLFALLVLWAYLDFMQVLIVWNSNLPDEAAWYLKRLVGSWALIAALIAALHFLLPFFALIWPQVQRSRVAIAWVAGVLVLIEVPRAWWIVIPAAGRNLSLLDLAAMMALLGLAAAIALRASRSAALQSIASEHA